MIIGRELELSRFEMIFKSKKAEFVAVYGRRRVGKTFLIREFFSKKSCAFFYALGIQHGSMHQQIYSFIRSIEETFYSPGITLKEPGTWAGAFELLNKHIGSHQGKKKLVLFFDELPWLASKKSGFLAQLDYYWNKYWSANPNVKLIVCGSAASWMIDNIIHQRGGFYNRLTSKILLDPFDIKDTKTFLLANGFTYTDTQVLDVYLAIGGIPYYLEMLDKRLSVPQNIDQLCFHSKGQLIDEFKLLYASLFTHAEYHEEIIRLLASKRKGMSKTELLEKSKLSSDGGTFTKRLGELEASGFIVSFKPYGYKDRNTYFRICDEFTLFYLSWIEPNLTTIKGIKKIGHYWLEVCQSPSFKSWAGYAFEELCFKHIDEIKQALFIQTSAVTGSWQYIPKKGSDDSGAQIDLLFDRNDGVITICEMKHTNQPYQLTKEEANLLLLKIDRFKTRTKTMKQIQIVLVTNIPIKKTLYSEEIIARNITLGDLIHRG